MADPLDAVWVEPIVTHADARGVLSKVFPHPVGGEVYLVSFVPGASRGHHLHRRSGEWFAGVQGAPLLVVADPDSGTRRAIPLAGQRVWVPAGWAHAIFASDDAGCLVAAAMDRPHDPDDVLPWPVERP
jgi:UDP-2-acetamido-2,6-beta-L-arabino-hexul-4-ose reductase